MIKEIKINNREPIAYTDFSAIYLSRFLIKEEYITARRHELSHIWLQHQIRCDLFIKKNKNVDSHILNMAMDYEIAKHIYTDEDNDAIEKPRSFLSGGITTKLANDLSSDYFEEMYFELLKNNKKYKNFDQHNFEKSKKTTKGKINKKEVVASGKKAAKKDKEKTDKQKRSESLNNEIKSFKPPKPSLSSFMDAVFGRNKLKRDRSYKRPSRIEHNNGLLMPGKILKKKIPRVTIYVDRSGSFSSEKTLKATQLINKIVEKYRCKIKKDFIYFNNDLFFIDTGVGSGSTNYGAVMRYVAGNYSELSIIITDDDYAEKGNEEVDTNKIIIIPVGCKRTVLAQKYKIREINI